MLVDSITHFSVLYVGCDRFEVDLVLERSDQVVLTEIKSGATVAADFFLPVERLAPLVARGARTVESRVVYGGEASQHRSGATVVPWHRVPEARWAE